MKRVLITGMSGTGKSTVIRMLAERGYKAIDADYGLSEWVPVSDPSHMYSSAEREWMWREDLVQRLLSTEDTDLLFISGCARNWTKFRSQFDHVVLLSAPAEMILERLATRTTNPYGKSADEVTHVMQLLQTVEPRLRASASLEVDTRIPANDVVNVILDAVNPAAVDTRRPGTVPR
jgi:shikimate kinase